MPNKIINFLLKFIFIKIYLFFIKKNFKIDSYDYNFLNLEFNDNKNLKKILFSKQNHNYKKYDQANYTYHSFDWLNIAKKIGGGSNIIKAKKNFINWKKNSYKKNSYVWSSFFISKRFINTIYNYDFFANTSSKIDKKLIHTFLLEHYILLGSDIRCKEIYSISIDECKALILGSLIYKKNFINCISLLKKIISLHIDKNGFHKSYNASKQGEFINNLYEIKNIMLYFNINIPEELSFQILNMTSMLKSLIHDDGSLVLFNGSNNFHINKILKIIEKEKDLKSKNLKKIDQGIISYVDENKKIFLDVVKPVSKKINKDFHAGTLSFELSCLSEKIITNCGALNKKFNNNPEYLRYSAAHSTIVINNKNISELVHKKSFKRAPQNIILSKYENENSIEWEASHDGYFNNFKKIIKRKIKISKNSNSIIGQDEIISTKANTNKDNYSIRFHLMPNCSCLITNNKKSVLLKTNLKQSWIFKFSSQIEIEDSIYVGNGKRVEQNKQIVIYGNIQNKKKIERWSLKKYNE